MYSPNCKGSWKISLRNAFKNYRRDHCPRAACKRPTNSDIHPHHSKKTRLTEVVQPTLICTVNIPATIFFFFKKFKKIFFFKGK